FGATDRVIRLRVHRGPAVDAAVGELEARSVALALDPSSVVDELSIRERAAFMRSGVVKRGDRLPSPHQGQRLCACIGLRRLVLRHALDVERLPFRAAAAPRVAVDLPPQLDDALAT